MMYQAEENNLLFLKCSPIRKREYYRNQYNKDLLDLLYQLSLIQRIRQLYKRYHLKHVAATTGLTLISIKLRAIIEIISKR